MCRNDHHDDCLTETNCSRSFFFTRSVVVRSRENHLGPNFPRPSYVFFLFFFSHVLLQVYERAIANVPPVLEKRYWRRYIYLWINYALFEELQAEDAQRTR